MHKLVEDYLAVMADKLQPLPANQRNEELKEMRQHLLNAATVNRESGQSEEAAAANAIEQFGMPQKTASQIVQAWRRGNLRARHGFWSTMACACTLWLLLPRIVTPVILVCFQQNAPGRYASPNAMTLIGISGFVFVVPLLVGVICGCFFPKQATTGTAWGTLLCSCFLVVVFTTASAERHMLVNVPAYVSTLFMRDIVAILVAWAVSQGPGKIKGTSRPRPAR